MFSRQFGKDHRAVDRGICNVACLAFVSRGSGYCIFDDEALHHAWSQVFFIQAFRFKPGNHE